MLTSLILTVIGADKPGLVDSLSHVVTAHEGNWLESRMARLGGRFAGILLLTVPEPNVAALTRALRKLEARGLNLTIVTNGVEEAAQHSRALIVELLGHDRPGIVRDISHALASRNVNIDELETGCSNASWSGESMFHAKAHLRVPQDVSVDELRSLLEALANDLMVDITLDVPDKTGDVPDKTGNVPGKTSSAD